MIAATGKSIGLGEAAWIGSLALLVQVLPLSLAGVGVREGAFAYLFGLFGLPPETGVLVGLLVFSQMLAIALVGGLLRFQAIEKAPKPAG